MDKKRRDKKGRVLRDGEYQRSDGKYQFNFVDSSGQTRYLYSWKLVNSDPLPSGKRQCKPLRDQERELETDILNGIAICSNGLTVLDIVKKYIALKNGVRASTRAGYKTVVNMLEKDPFSSKRIDQVKLSDAKLWLIKLQKRDGKSYSSIHTIRGVLRPAFQMAVDDDLIRKNPFDFPLVNVIVNDSIRRDALTREQERMFLKFIRYDEHYSKYYDAIYILFNTGMRISEFAGLTAKDIDLDAKRVTINKQLLRSSDMEYIIEKPKTEAGNRIIPISDDVCECFIDILQNRKSNKTEPMIDGYGGFLFLDKNGMPMVALHWENIFQRIVAKYNDIFKVPMPPVTPHVCRHTYCSHMASSGINPKYLQYLMGHSDISVTLNTYTHIEFDDMENKVRELYLRN